MEDQDSKVQGNQPRTFNDIQPPQSQSTDPVQTTVESTPQTLAGAELVEAPVDDTIDQAVPATTEPEQVAPLIATMSPRAADHKAPVGVIVVAVLIAVALAGVAVLTYMKNDQKEAASQKAAPTAQQTEQSVTADDVDTTTKDIDSSLDQADDATDFNTNSLSDSSLNL